MLSSRLAAKQTMRYPLKRSSLASALLFLSATQPAKCFSVATPFVHLSSSVSKIRTSELASSGFRGGASKSWISNSPTDIKSKFGYATSGGSRTKTDMASTMEATTKETADMTAADRLSALRSKMKELNLDVYLVPTDDPHLSEYVPEAYKRRAFLTGFTGSAGTAVVTHDDARLWTDSRYWNEAGMQLDSSQWKLVKSGLPDTPSIPKFLGDLAASHFQQRKKPLRVGLDPFVHAASFPKEIEESFEDAASKELDIEDEDVEIGVIDTSNDNLIDPIWGEQRPPIPTSPFRVHPIEYSGISIENKVKKIRTEMEEKKATLAIFCTLDDVAYLLNVRAMGDVETCPVGISYATVSTDEITLYCDPKKVESKEVQEHLSGVTIKPYDDIVTDIEKHCSENKKSKVWLDKSRANYKLSSIIPKKKLIDEQNAVTPMKACKNKAEMEGMRRAHIVDGAAMAKFMAWLEHTIVTEGRAVSEVEIDEKLTACRAEQPGFLEVSFPTIAGVGPNGAIIHYRAQEGTELLKYLDASNPILIDSGGQYTYGTTDVTRTWHFGEASDEFIDYYTRVLKGNIGVDTMVFPENTPGFVLDVFARKSLWMAGKDYGHGTGHGVGAALNVHEGPMSISPRWANKEGLKRGMVISNEPGYYEDGNFGVRIENLLELSYVKEEYNIQAEKLESGEDSPEDDDSASSQPKSSDKKFLKFDSLTMIPIQKSLINTKLLTNEEIEWLDNYHAGVFEKISPLLKKDSPAMKWLEKSCTKLDRE